MHETLEKIQKTLKQTISQLQSAVPSDEPFGIAHNNWSYPGLTRGELVEIAQSIIDSIELGGSEDLGDSEARLTDYIRRLIYLNNNTIPNLWGNAAQGVVTYLLTLEGLQRALGPTLKNGRADAIAVLRRVQSQLRGMESRIAEIEPRVKPITAMIEKIENACEAADQLPEDLESLAESRHKVAKFLELASADAAALSKVREAGVTYDEQMSKSVGDAKAVLERCETAYSASTSVGLAAAFAERSSALSKSMWTWVFGLVLALGAGSYFGAGRLQALSELVKTPSAPTSMVVLNLLLSLLSVGAPIWFSWLATKQIGQRFRLSEDYAFKASISRAYEGFRREAARIDKDMESRLLASALARLDELPLRLVETESHGSPWHELATSEVVKQAMRTVPDFLGQIKDLARNGIDGLLLAKATAKKEAE